MPKEPKMIEIPFHLAKLITADPSELKDPNKHEALHEAAVAMLRLLMEA